MMNAVCLLPRTEQNAVCFTGHRNLDPEEIAIVRERLRQMIRECFSAGYRWFICGGALGFDTLAATAVLEEKRQNNQIGLFLAVPCGDQARQWQKHEQAVYREILDSADEKIILSDHYYSGCMHMRNQYMVQHSSLCICYLRSFTGGTGFTVRYAIACNRRVVNLCLPDSVPLKEPSWNSTFTFPFVSANALTVPLLPFRLATGRKWSVMSVRSSGKRPCAGHS